MKRSFGNFLGFFKVVKEKSHQIRSPDLPEDTCRQFSLADIKAATNNFHLDSILGYGSFGIVYKGTIHNGIMVAVKRYQSRSFPGVEEYRNEVKLLCQLRHPHLLSLIGFCHEQNEMILVYEYMSRGQLSDYLFGKAYFVPLGWTHRLQICIGVARGLHYLHTRAKRAIIHGDFNCKHILLDDEGSSKLSGFTLPKIGPPSMSKRLIRIESKNIVGTCGYGAPEYIRYGELTEKADVFSFGVVLLEVLCGRESYDRELPEPELLVWVSNFIREGTIYQVIDPYLKGSIAPNCFKKYLEIACSCVQYNRNERPDMGEVEVTLELALELQKKADFEMNGNNSHGECMYKDSSFHSTYRL